MGFEVISRDLNYTPHVIANKLQFKESLKRIIANNQKLELLKIEDHGFGYFDTICDGIEIGLDLSKEKEGNLRIFIYINYIIEDKYRSIAIPKSSAILMRIKNLLDQLESLKLDNFMLCVSIDDRFL